MGKDIAQSLPLFSAHRLVEGDDHPVHLSGGEIATKITAEPELDRAQISGSVISLVDLIGDVEPTVMFHLAIVVVRRRVRVEIAYAEVRATACLNGRDIERPI